MNFRLTFALVILMLLAGAIFFWAQGRPAENKSSIPTNTVFSPAPADVVSLTLLRGEEPEVGFAKTADKWALTQPIKAAVESWQVDSVATMLKDLAYKEKFVPEATGARSLDATGLAKPRFSIRFEDSAKHQYTLLLGKRTPAGSSYAQVAGDANKTIYVLDSNPVDRLDKDPSEFRSKDLVDAQTDKVTSITVGQPKQKVVLGKANGKWIVEQPVPTRANGQAVDDLLTQFKQLKVDQFVTLTRKDAASGLQVPTLSVSVVETEAAPAATTGPATAPATAPAKTKVTTLDFGNYSDLTRALVYASVAGSDEAVLVQASAVAKLRKELNDLRDPAITPAPVADATVIEMQGAGGGEKMALTKDAAGTWRAEEGKLAMPAETTVVTDFLGALRDLRANKYVDAAGDLKTIGLDPPQRTITLQLPGQTQRETILIGKAQAAEPLTPVQRQGEGTVYLVQTQDLAKLSPTVLDLRSKAVATWKPDAVFSIELSGPGVKYPATLTRDGTKWKLTAGGKEMAPDDVKVSALLGDFDSLQATKWDGMTGPAANAKAVATVRLSVADNPGAAAGTQPGTQPATKPAALGPTLPKTVEVKLYQGADKSWTAFTDAASPAWVFTPTTAFADHVTTVDYRPASATQAATQSATQSATPPATMP